MKVVRVKPARKKHTIPPPNVCHGCYWEQKSKRLAAVLKHQRLEHIQLIQGKRGKRTDALPKERDDEHDDEVPDVLDKISNGRLGVDE